MTTLVIETVERRVPHTVVTGVSNERGKKRERGREVGGEREG